MTSVSSALRNKLERTTVQARDVAEDAARAALERLAVGQGEPYEHLNEPQRQLRTQLRAHGRQIGDIRQPNKTQSLDRLVQELAYEYWHRMLFARFLAENHLLIKPDEGIAVTLEECEYYATEEGTDAWTLAGRFASQMLPQIFRPDSPLLQVPFLPEHKQALEGLLAALTSEVFNAADSLGWSYQFWQTLRKKQVNESGVKIGAAELPAVTQLFTEDYMVDFLLDNTLGAWHAGKILAANPKLAETSQSEDDLRQIVSLPGCSWNYLRFIKDQDGKWTPAAGTFDGWPKSAKELKCLDPCMGSGHFVVAMFGRLVALRLAEETIDEQATVAAVIRDNLFGLELDPRCTQIGAFNLALAAWRRVGHCALPAMNLACSGLAPNTSESNWLAITGDSEKLQRGMERLYRLFQKAAVLGSLINPRAGQGDLLEASFHELQPLLEKALAQETEDDAVQEMAVTARGLAKAANILSGKFTLVATNVPYLGQRKQGDELRTYLESHYPTGKADLANAFILRALDHCERMGSVALVTPHSWMFQTSSIEMRKDLLNDSSVNGVVTLGEEAWWSFGMRGPRTALFIASTSAPAADSRFFGIDVSTNRGERMIGLEEKAALLAGCDLSAILSIAQASQLRNPDSRIHFGESSEGPLLSAFVDSAQGIKTGDDERWRRRFWELARLGGDWHFYQSSGTDTKPYQGASFIIDWRTGGKGMVRPRLENIVQGRRGVAISPIGKIPSALYLGERFESSVAPLVPKESSHLNALWAYVSSDEYRTNIRSIDKKLSVTTDTLAKVPFDLARWQNVAAEQYPYGLPEPFSSDPTQWLFNGYPARADQPLQAAVIRLLGYQWPRQTGSSLPNCPTLAPDGLETLADRDGIVCLPAVRGERPADTRLRDLLRAAYGSDWSPQLLDKLIQQSGGAAGMSLDDWLRNTFFEQHSKLFHRRPFIWHIWDGRKKDGFHALVNYHNLDRKGLETLIYTYLGDWITHLKSDEEANEPRILAARELKEKLEAILHGEADLDIFVRWKPLQEQAIGWEPDLNDGVRMNIRPFIMANVLRKAPKIDWNKDRGKEPERDKDDYPWFWSGKKFTGDRVNDVHLSLEEKRSARASRPARREAKPAKQKALTTADDESEPSADPTRSRKTKSHTAARSEVATTTVTATRPAKEDLIVAVRKAFSSGGARDRETAVQDVFAHLPGQRLIPKMRKALENALRTAVRRGIVCADGKLLTADCRQIADYPRPLLKKALLSVLGGTWWEEADAIRAAARYLGFERASPGIQDAFKSAIRGGIRQGLVERDGQLIRKVR